MSGDKQSFSYFGPRQARLLSTLLTHAHLPGLTSLDQASVYARRSNQFNQIYYKTRLDGIESLSTL